MQDDLNNLECLIVKFEESKCSDQETQHLIEEQISLLRLKYYRTNPMFQQLKQRYYQAKRSAIHPELIPETEICFDVGHALQKASEEKLQSMVQTTTRAKELANMTTTQLAHQMEQVARMHEILDEIEPTLVRANRHLKRMTRAVVTNKYLWVLIFLIVVGIGVILYFKY